MCYQRVYTYHLGHPPNVYHNGPYLQNIHGLRRPFVHPIDQHYVEQVHNPEYVSGVFLYPPIDDVAYEDLEIPEHILLELGILPPYFKNHRPHSVPIILPPPVYLPQIKHHAPEGNIPIKETEVWLPSQNLITNNFWETMQPEIFQFRRTLKSISVPYQPPAHHIPKHEGGHHKHKEHTKVVEKLTTVETEQTTEVPTTTTTQKFSHVDNSLYY